MTHAEAEEFIKTVIGSGDVMDVRTVMEKYRGLTLREALTVYYCELMPYGVPDQFINNSDDYTK